MAATETKPSLESKTVYRRLLIEAKRYLVYFIIGIVGTVGISMVDAGFTWFLKPIVDKGFISQNISFLHMLPLIVIGIFLVRGITSFVSDYYITLVSRNVVMSFRQKLFHHFMKLPAKFFDHSSSGNLLSVIIYNVEQVADASSDTIIQFLRDASLAVSLIVLLIHLSWRLSLLMFVVSPVVYLVLKIASKRMRRLSTNVQDTMASVTHIAEEGIEGYRVVRLFGGQKYETDKFDEVTRSNRLREMKVVITDSISSSSVQFIFAIPICIILYCATLPAFHVSTGSFAAMIAAMGSLLRPIKRLTTVNTRIQKGIAGAASIFELLDQPPEVDKGELVVEKVAGRIDFQSVNFKYKSSAQQILKNINLSIRPGEMVAIVGRSGGGKTTLVSLLPRFYDVVSGNILIDGKDTREYTLASLRNQFSLVSQNTMLFNDTIAKNIAYGLGDHFPEDKILAAANAAQVMEFVSELPEGLNSLVGENGVLLSGGQRQRIAIARALLKDSPILILDEATASLDTHSERLIQTALDSLMKSRTTIVIAHRLSTIENADRIVVMRKGEIAEIGTHQELLVQGGGYKKLYDLQFKKQELAA